MRRPFPGWLASLRPDKLAVWYFGSPASNLFLPFGFMPKHKRTAQPDTAASQAKPSQAKPGCQITEVAYGGFRNLPGETRAAVGKHWAWGFIRIVLWSPWLIKRASLLAYFRAAIGNQSVLCPGTGRGSAPFSPSIFSLLSNLAFCPC